MDLGQKIKAARLEAGLSQRQLCGDRLTRNMLSLIENGSARPSMDTLAYLAQQLGKSVSYFLEEQAVTSPNRQCMEDARTALALEDPDALRQALDLFKEPDAVFFEERQLLEYLWHLSAAQQALEKGALPYARKLAENADRITGLYITQPLRQRRRVLLGLAGGEARLACDEEALLVRAMEAPTPERTMEILSACEDKASPVWNQLYGDALLALGNYEAAAVFLRKAPPTMQNFARLEVCFRELGDFKQAYEYACKQR
jgi:transcriptional regulator with XRE-family HTH domain